MISVSVIGMGALGEALVNRFINLGIDVSVHNRTKSKLTSVIARGAKPIDDLAQDIMVEKKIWFLCLRDEASIFEVFSSFEVKEASKLQSFLVVNLSTVGPKASIRLEAFFAGCDIDYVELPVSGGVEGVLSGELIGYVGKLPNVLAPEFEALLNLLLKKYAIMSSNQDAQAMKVVNNYCESINLIVASEALLVAQTFGISKDVIGKSLALGRGRSDYLELLMGRYLNSETHVSVPLEIRIKDLELAYAMFSDLKINSLFYEEAHRVYVGTLKSSNTVLDQTGCFAYLSNSSRGVK